MLYSTISTPPPLPGLSRTGNYVLRYAVPTISHSLRVTSPSGVRVNSVRCRVNRSGSSYSPLNSGDRPPTDMAPLFPGCDYEHWLIVMDKPGGEEATKPQMIECYIQTLAQVLGSEEEAKKKIYNVSCERYFGFGCEIDEETSNKLEGLPGVLFVLPDAYVDADYVNYDDKYEEEEEEDDDGDDDGMGDREDYFVEGYMNNDFHEEGNRSGGGEQAENVERSLDE